MRHLKLWSMLVCAVVLCAMTANAASIWAVESLTNAGTTTGATSIAPAYLYKFDSSGSNLQTIGIITLNGLNVDVDGLAISGDGLLYAFARSGTESNPSSTLISLNRRNATATSIGAALAGRDIRGATFAWGVLLALDARTNQLLRIDPATGQLLSQTALTMGGSGYDLTNATDLVLGTNGIVYVVEGDRDTTIAGGQGGNGTRFYTLNASTGALTQIASNQDSQIIGVGVAYVPGSLIVSEMSFSDDLFRYNTSTLAGTNPPHTSILTDPILQNAGRGDLASNTPEPAAFILGGTALLAFGLLRRRRRSAN